MQPVGTRAKPFLKWAGGKTRLLPDIQKSLPPELGQGKIKRYIEPFIGGGAVFFFVAQFYGVEEIIISDINTELLVPYQTVRDDVEGLIKRLSRMSKTFLSLSETERARFFYEQRDSFNKSRGKIEFQHFQPTWVRRTAQFIFLNHTCFNGLYRTNSKLDFNVPFGRYKQPTIFDEHNLRAVSRILQKVKISHGDFETCYESADKNTFVYFDPPYRPLSKTANFNTYYKAAFSDDEQTRLAALFRRLDAKGAKLMLSNSDPKNQNPRDKFFDNLYKGFRIKRVKAARAINSNAARRGQISELVITNY
ncbi:MAG TPA: DNA adenine methylase [Pyrinomonadaceae bacterium]|nr:DNA adenine methylase [Pyrinomonadaceae bacterium]